jgi:two-component system OmpR family response regulator
MRILIVEDDELLSDSLRRAMRMAGHAAECAQDGEYASALIQDSHYDLVILDLNLPRVDGLTVLKQLRIRRPDLPVIILTARDTIEDRVHGLDLGADDYLVKPFSLAELEARVRALLRRGRGGGAALMAYGPLVFDTAGRRVTVNDVEVDLSSRELSVLETLLFRQGKVVSKEQLIESFCGWGDEVSPNAIEVYVHRLRRKIESGGVTVRTLRGLGYMLDKSPMKTT